MNFIKKFFGKKKQEEEKNISYELFMAFEKYFFGDDVVEAEKFSELGIFTDVVLDINTLPFCSNNIDEKKRKKISKSMVFSRLRHWQKILERGC